MGRTGGVEAASKDGGGTAVGLMGLGLVGFVYFRSVATLISTGPRIYDKERSEKDEIGMVSPSMIACDAIKASFQSLIVFVHLD
jgi:hypothetical protein